MIILAPIALFFLASFLLTRRWYVRAQSVPGLILGAVVQPLFTAAIFATGMHLIGQARSGPSGSTFASGFLASELFTLVIATPIALLSCIEPIKRMRSQYPDQARDIGDDGFVTLMMAGLISLVCAALAVATVLILIHQFR